MWRVLEHTTDLYIEGRGKSEKEALNELINGMVSHIGNGKKSEVEFIVERKDDYIDVKIIECLNDIIAKCEDEEVSPVKAEVLEFSEDGELRVKIIGEKKHPHNIIKSATYHLFYYNQEKDEFVIRVLFDI